MPSITGWTFIPRQSAFSGKCQLTQPVRLIGVSVSNLERNALADALVPARTKEGVHLAKPWTTSMTAMEASRSPGARWHSGTTMVG